MSWTEQRCEVGSKTTESVMEEELSGWGPVRFTDVYIYFVFNLVKSWVSIPVQDWNSNYLGHQRNLLNGIRVQKT